MIQSISHKSLHRFTVQRPLFHTPVNFCALTTMALHTVELTCALSITNCGYIINGLKEKIPFYCAWTTARPRHLVALETKEWRMTLWRWKSIGSTVACRWVASEESLCGTDNMLSSLQFNLLWGFSYRRCRHWWRSGRAAKSRSRIMAHSRWWLDFRFMNLLFGNMFDGTLLFVSLTGDHRLTRWLATHLRIKRNPPNV